MTSSGRRCGFPYNLTLMDLIAGHLLAIYCAVSSSIPQFLQSSYKYLMVIHRQTGQHNVTKVKLWIWHSISFVRSLHWCSGINAWFGKLWNCKMAVLSSGDSRRPDVETQFKDKAIPFQLNFSLWSPLSMLLVVYGSICCLWSMVLWLNHIKNIEI